MITQKLNNGSNTLSLIILLLIKLLEKLHRNCKF